MAESAWPAIHAERAALAADLEGLTDAQWGTKSLCDEWTVEQLLGHMTATATMSPGGFFGRFIGSGFNFAKMANKDVAAMTTGGPKQTLSRFKAAVNDTKSPPGPKDTWLGETVVHSADIRRPLGIAHAYPVATLTRVADFYKNSNAIIGTKKRIAGMTLRATDADWSTGDGPEVSGPMLSLVQAMTGRKAALDDLSGDGVAMLRSRG